MNIGFVGVGRMGANMARRLADCGFHVTAVYDVNRAAATKLASELGCAASQNLSDVTAESDVVITVVSDDAAMRKIFAKSGDSLLVNARGKLFINCAKFFLKPVRPRAFCKRTAKTCRTENTAAFSRLRTPPKTVGSRSNLLANLVSSSRLLTRPKSNTTR